MNENMGDLRYLYWQLEGMDSERYREFWYALKCERELAKKSPEEALAHLIAFIDKIEEDVENAGKCPSCGGDIVERYEGDYVYKVCKECGEEISRERTHESLSSVENREWLSAKRCV